MNAKSNEFQSFSLDPSSGRTNGASPPPETFDPFGKTGFANGDFELPTLAVRVRSVAGLVVIGALTAVLVTELINGGGASGLVLVLFLMAQNLQFHLKRLFRPPRLSVHHGTFDADFNGKITTPTDNVVGLIHTGSALIFQFREPPSGMVMPETAASNPLLWGFPEINFPQYLRLRHALGLRDDLRTPAQVETDAYFSAAESGGRAGWITYGMTAVLVGVWLLQLAKGVGPLGATTEQSTAWGANVAVRTIHGEYWRLFSSWFLHMGALHLLANVWTLLWLGRRAERIFGPFGFMFLYAFSGYIAAVCSTVFHPVGVCVGASGAIFGLIGALARIGFWPPAGTPIPFSRSLRSPMVMTLALNLFITWGIPQIDQAAHIGGALAGFLCAFALGDFRSGLGRKLFVAIAMAATAGAATPAIFHYALAHERTKFEFAAAFNQLGENEHAVLAAFNKASEEFRTQKLDDDQFANVIDREIIPQWKKIFEPVIAGWSEALPGDKEMPERIRAYYNGRLQGFEFVRDGARKRDVKMFNQGFERLKQATEILDAPAGRKR